MPAFKCPRHRMQIAGRFCEHAASAVEKSLPMRVFLQRDRWGWFTLCPTCIFLPEEELDTDFLVCEKCVAEWAVATENDYLERCASPTEEHPSPRSG